ncbi:DUF6256 family protein [Streptomyces viridochromogenes]|uniref:Uncharacterized protein n=1 Tax=Streptomyces viridochromogenes Tue57 TaxID=1160705 RepID=L8PSM3_STRVR|nr:DUF6256 family protein [Streptomyces viridochromogenes]ELS58407.1 hypothetical protein STVIR_0649 [Streptomyces viridochromogenes Tue57]
MLSGYLLVMGYLAVGLRLLCRQRPGPAKSAEKPERRLSKQLAPGAARRGWPGLIRQVLGTAVGGYVLLMAVVVGYYYGVMRLGGHFLTSAFTGCVLLVGIALPVFFALSWLTERQRRRRGSQ